MADTPEKRIAQLESIVNELTARVAGDPGNADLPPLLASAQAELVALKASAAAGTTGATGAAGAPTAAPAAVVRPKLAVPPVKPDAAPSKPAAAVPTAPAAATVAKKVETGLGKAAMRPSPAVPRSQPVNPALDKVPNK